jgi:hypothetical protein
MLQFAPLFQCCNSRHYCRLVYSRNRTNARKPFRNRGRFDYIQAVQSRWAIIIPHDRDRDRDRIPIFLQVAVCQRC